MYVAMIACMYGMHAVINRKCRKLSTRGLRSNDIIIEGGVSSILEAKPWVPLSSAQVAVVDSSGVCTQLYGKCMLYYTCGAHL